MDEELAGWQQAIKLMEEAARIGKEDYVHLHSGSYSRKLLYLQDILTLLLMNSRNSDKTSPMTRLLSNDMCQGRLVIVKTFNWLSCFYLARYETTRYTDSVGCILHAIELFSGFKANNRFSFSHSVRPLSNETVFLVFIFLSCDFPLLQETPSITPCANT